jgi:septum formation protein
MKLPPVVLASQSPRRVHLLREVIPDFQVTASYAVELDHSEDGPRRLCELNAQRKAMAVAERYPQALVLGADTLVFLDDQPLSKPADLDEARRMLRRLGNRIHQVITGVCLYHHSASRMRVFSEVTYVKFHPIDDPIIDQYLSQVEVLDKAGAYAIQESGHLLVEKVEGSFSNVVGLPVEAVRAAFQKWPTNGETNSSRS